MGKDLTKEKEDFSFFPDYPDIVHGHPDWTDEDYENHLKMRKSTSGRHYY